MWFEEEECRTQYLKRRCGCHNTDVLVVINSENSQRCYRGWEGYIPCDLALGVIQFVRIAVIRILEIYILALLFSK